jgi:hypothetical protein
MRDSGMTILYIKVIPNCIFKRHNTSKNALNHQIYMDYTINKLKYTLKKLMYIIFIYEFNI